MCSATNYECGNAENFPVITVKRIPADSFANLMINLGNDGPAKEDTVIGYGIFEDGILVAAGGYYLVSLQTSSYAIIMYGTVEGYRGMGYGSRAAQEATKAVLNRKIASWAGVTKRNKISRHIIEKLGYKKEIQLPFQSSEDVNWFVKEP